MSNNFYLNILKSSFTYCMLIHKVNDYISIKWSSLLITIFRLISPYKDCIATLSVSREQLKFKWDKLTGPSDPPNLSHLLIWPTWHTFPLDPDDPQALLLCKLVKLPTGCLDQTCPMWFIWHTHMAHLSHRGPFRPFWPTFHFHPAPLGCLIHLAWPMWPTWNTWPTLLMTN
jgi:hypothetical protein